MLPDKRLIIGLLGGSFNPAHAGHVHISLAAKKALGLDAVWWLVSPQNPLKSASGMMEYRDRFSQAKAVAAPYLFIHVSDFEVRAGTRYTVDTLMALKRAMPRARFVWLMGGDNLASFHRWRQWRRIMDICPVLVLDRAPFSHASLRSKAALAFDKYRVLDRDIRSLSDKPLPAWGYLHMKRHPASATEIRKKLGKTA